MISRRLRISSSCRYEAAHGPTLFVFSCFLVAGAHFLVAWCGVVVAPSIRKHSRLFNTRNISATHIFRLPNAHAAVTKFTARHPNTTITHTHTHPIHSFTHTHSQPRFRFSTEVGAFQRVKKTPFTRTTQDASS